MQSLVVVKKISDGMIRLHMHGSGHAADRVAANADADLYGINTERIYYSPHDGNLFHAAYDGTLRVVEEAKGVCGRTWICQGAKGRWEKRGRQRWEIDVNNDSLRTYEVVTYIHNAVKNIHLEEDIVNPHNAVAILFVEIRVTHQPRSSRTSFFLLPLLFLVFVYPPSVARPCFLLPIPGFANGAVIDDDESPSAL